jgi:hypothetical protein
MHHQWIKKKFLHQQTLLMTFQMTNLPLMAHGNTMIFHILFFVFFVFHSQRIEMKDYNGWISREKTHSNTTNGNLMFLFYFIFFRFGMVPMVIQHCWDNIVIMNSHQWLHQRIAIYGCIFILMTILNIVVLLLFMSICPDPRHVSRNIPTKQNM